MRLSESVGPSLAAHETRVPFFPELQLDLVLFCFTPVTHSGSMSVTTGWGGQAGALWACHCMGRKAPVRWDTCLLVPIPTQPSKGEQRGGPPGAAPQLIFP